MKEEKTRNDFKLLESSTEQLINENKNEINDEDTFVLHKSNKENELQKITFEQVERENDEFSESLSEILKNVSTTDTDINKNDTVLIKNESDSENNLTNEPSSSKMYTKISEYTKLTELDIVHNSIAEVVTKENLKDYDVLGENLASNKTTNIMYQKIKDKILYTAEENIQSKNTGHDEQTNCKRSAEHSSHNASDEFEKNEELQSIVCYNVLSGTPKPKLGKLLFVSFIVV